MRKVYKKLTKDQISRNVIFSSELIGGGTIHEVFKDDEDWEADIGRLLDDKFFNGSHFRHNEIRK